MISKFPTPDPSCSLILLDVVQLISIPVFGIPSRTQTRFAYHKFYIYIEQNTYKKMNITRGLAVNEKTQVHGNMNIFLPYITGAGRRPV
jgi:hypothetical protein